MSDMLHRRLRGFTLVEVLAAIALLVLLAAAVMSFLGVLRERQKTVGDAYERQRGLAIVMERMDAEIITCFADDGEGHAGIEGSENSLKLGSRGVGIATLGAQSMRMSSTQISEISLAGDELRMSRSESEGALPQVLRVQKVGKVRFRYHDGKSWLSSFNSRSAKGLPVAIEVSVWFAQSMPAEHSVGGSAETADGESESTREFSDAGVVEIPPDRVRIYVVPDGASASDVTDESLDQPASKPSASEKEPGGEP